MADTAEYWPDVDELTPLERFDAMEKQKQTHVTNWERISTYVFPKRSLYQDLHGRNEPVGENIYDGTAIAANNLLANGLMGYLVSPSYPWYKLRLPWPKANKLPGVPEWLDLVEGVIYDDFSKSNFYDETPLLFKDLGAIGNGTMWTEELPDDVVHFTSMHPYEFFWDVDDFWRIDTVYRRQWMTVRQCVIKFGVENLSTETQGLVRQKKFDEWREIIHAVEPRGSRDVDTIGNRAFAIASQYWERGPEHLIRESGYEKMPAVPVRWSTNSGDIYGWGPGTEALIDILRANQMGRDLMEAAHQSVKPPYNVPEYMRNRFTTRPDGRNYYKTADQVAKPLESSREFPIAIDREQDVRQRIEDHFMVDFFLMLQRMNNKSKTATEIMEMQAEKAAILGTLVGRLSTEFLDPVIDLMFHYGRRAGRIPPPPQSLFMWMAANGHNTGKLKVEYIGPLAQAQKRFHVTQGVIQGLQRSLPFAQFWPEILDAFKPIEAIRKITDASGMPAEVMRDDKEIAQRQMQRQKAQQQAMMAQQQAEGAKAYKDMTAAPEQGSPAESIGDMLRQTISAGGNQQ